MNVHVGSKSQTTILVTVEGRGYTPVDARRSAIQFARARYSISDPIALSEHEAAVRMRQIFVAQFAPKMPDLNTAKPFSDVSDRFPLYDKR